MKNTCLITLLCCFILLPVSLGAAPVAKERVVKERGVEDLKQGASPSDDEIFASIIEKINDFELEIKQKFKQLYRLKGEQRMLLGASVVSLERLISKQIEAAVVLLLEMKEEDIDIQDKTKSLSRHINKRNIQLFKEYNMVVERIEEAGEGLAKIDSEKLFEYEQLINTMRQVLIDFLYVIQSNISDKLKLNLDVHYDQRLFTALLNDAAAETAIRLKLATEQLAHKSEEIAKSLDTDKTKLNSQLAALTEKQTGISNTLSALISMMKHYDLDTTVYSQLLMTSSGTINEQIFNKEVIAGLLSQWLRDLKKWLAFNASGFLTSALIILFILLVFHLLGMLVSRIVTRLLSSSKVSISTLLREFFVASSRRLVIFVGYLIALSQLGIELGPLLAGLGVVGFIVGFALQGVLSNFASGLMILIYRPYDVGDVVEIAGIMGTVKEMSMVSTTMLSFSNEKLVIPNNNIWGSLIKNITSEATRRVDLVVKISFEADINQLESIFTEEVRANKLILSEPAPTIQLHKQHETHLEYIVRPWVKTGDYWSVYWSLNKAIKNRMDSAGVPKLLPYAFLAGPKA